MTLIVDLNTGQVLGMDNSRDDKGCRGIAVRLPSGWLLTV